MWSIPLLFFFLLSVWRLSCSLTAGSSPEEKSSLPPKAARHDLCLVVIIDAPSHRVVACILIVLAKSYIELAMKNKVFLI